MKFKQVLLIVAISAGSAVGSVALYNKYLNTENITVGSAEKGLPANYAGFFDGKPGAPAEGLDFVKAANSAVPAVVHIKTKIPAKKVSNNLPRNRNFDDFFDQFFGEGFGPNIIPEQRASGSGVIISEDGYIVTNNHVISDQGGGIAAEINVTLSNRKTYKARVIGRDPSSDLAVLKIDASKLPFMVYGNSDNIQLGQWVLAIGYPLTLDATVTAGIVSATGRSIGINSRQTQKGDTPVESFIQTDAAVNQGNSGGALINTNGELIGINSAILAPSGTYAGYSFAIPVNIIKKIVNDIIQYGDVQRGYLGVSYYPTDDVSDEQLKSLGIPTNVEGVYVSSVSSDGGASAAGIRKGDVITKVNNNRVVSGLQMSAQIAGFHPGDKVPVTYIRGGKEFTVTVALKKKSDVVSANISTRLKADLSTLSSDKASKYGIDGGVVINKIYEDSPFGRARIQPGFIITSVAGQQVTSLEDLTDLLSNIAGTVKVEGVYPGNDMPYSYPVNLDQ
ncbi:trypsin-like peptidase domain-containing protein [Flavisolibacter ginsengisoli]|jgi:Do/DeqQ family serine protease|uniref:Do/DeqQ family serine protease n=1 Tax=Flavisolibacter ginsengisoli DSM 18119 TaxID=1121884 RepID=A0A1M4X3W3_9BACT|nr:trypsin-like peptidase domain-containing protein [Flavisolibacter ginsengisoli]SHE88139.1 Do/DeqQ family serine protease [Flavisolibacter ginsengisoli DSM 18119]